MIALVGHVEACISGVALEVEVAKVYNHSAERRGMAVKVLGGGVNYYVRAELLGTAENGGCQRVVDYEEERVLFCDCAYLVEVKYYDGGVCDSLSKNELCPVVNEFFDVFGAVVGVEEAALYAYFGQGRAEEVECSAVARLRNEHIVAYACNGKGRKRRRGHAGGATYCAYAVLESGNPVFECRNGGVGKSGIEISVAL